MNGSMRMYTYVFAALCLVVSSHASAQMGACCNPNDGTCTVTLEADCTLEAAWIPDATCDPLGCPENFEAEPNNKFENPNVVTLAPGDTFSGVQREFTEVFFGPPDLTGSTTRDIWTVQTTAQPLGIYRHVIAPTVGERLMILVTGTQTNGVSNGPINSDDLSTLSATAIVPPIIWYGFGKQESVQVIVWGDDEEPGEDGRGLYTFQLNSTPVTPITAFGDVTGGNVTITVQGANFDGSVDMDTWLYDSNLDPVPQAGNDDSSGNPTDPSIFTASLPAGDYYLAIATEDLINDQLSPANDSFRDGLIFYSPGAVTGGNAFTPPDIFYGVTISDEDAGTSDVMATGSTTEYFGVSWVKFTVTGSPCTADFNGVNGVTVQDIFDFLTAWLAGNASADFNGVNGVTVQDIFDFLTAWLAGC